jgi:hypothetical protein
MPNYREIFDKLSATEEVTVPYAEFESAMINNPKYRNMILSSMNESEPNPFNQGAIPFTATTQPVSSRPADKKKVQTGSTASSSEDGRWGSTYMSPENIKFEEKTNRPIDNSRDESTYTAESPRSFRNMLPKPLSLEAQKPLSPIEAAQQKRKFVPSVKEQMDLPDAIEEQLSTINESLIDKEEQQVIPEMEYRFGPLGFDFKQTSMGDAMVVTAPNGNTLEVDLDPFTTKSETEESKKLKEFIRVNSAFIPNIKKLESQYQGENYKYKTEKEVDDELSKFQKSQKEFEVVANDFLVKKNALEAERDALEKATEAEKSTPEYAQRVKAFNDKLPEMQKQAAIVANGIGSIEESDARINRTVGKYIDMKAGQGGDVSGFFGATWNSFLGGFAKDPGVLFTRLTTKMTAGLFRVMDNLSGEPDSMSGNPKVTKEAAKSVGIEVPDSIKTSEEFRVWYKSLSKDVREKFNDAFYDKIDKEMSYGELDEATGIRKGGMIDMFRQGFERAWEDTSISKEYLQKLQSESWLAETYFSTVRSVGAIAGSPAPARIVKMFAMNTANVLDEMNRSPDFENVTENEKLGLVALLGTAQTVLEEFGFRNMINKKGLLNGLVMRVLRKNSGTITSKTFSDLLKNEIEAGLAKGILTLGAGFAAEAETGITQEISDISLKKLYELYKGNDNLFKDPKSVGDAIYQVLDAGLKEGVGGVMMTALPAASAAYTGKGFKAMTDEQFNMFRLAANDVKIQSAFMANIMARVNAGEITRTQAKETVDNYRSSVGLFNSLPTNITNIEAMKDAMNLLREKRALEEQRKNKDDALSKPIDDRIAQINEQLTKISENAIQEQAAGQVPVQPTPSISEGLAQGIPKPRVIYTPEEEAEKQDRKKQLEEAIASAPEGATEITIGEEVIPITEAKSEATTIAEELAGPTEAEAKQQAMFATEDATTQTLESMTPEQSNGIEFLNEDNAVVPVAGNESLLAKLYQGAVNIAEDARTDIQKAAVKAVEESSKTLLGKKAPIAPKVPPVAVHELDDLAEVEARVVGPIQKRVVASAKKILGAVKSIAPNIELYLHETQDSYNEAMALTKGNVESNGNFGKSTSGKVMRIDINLNKATDRTLAHEAAHAILYKVFNGNKKAINAFHRQLSGVISSMGKQDFIGDEGNMTTVKKHLNSFIKMYEDEKRPEEYMAELGGLMTAEGSNLSINGWRKIALAVNDFISRVSGTDFQLFENLSDARDIAEFFNSMASSFRTGEAIKEAPERLTKKYNKPTVNTVVNPEIDLSETESGDVVAGGVVDLDTLESSSSLPGFKKVTVAWSGIIKNVHGFNMKTPEVKTILEALKKSGGAAVVINSDATGIGKTEHGLIVQGGIGYTFIDVNASEGVAFAASSDKNISSFYKAVQETAKKRDEMHPEMKGMPVAVLVMIQSAPAMYGNAYGAEYFGMALKALTKTNKISTTEAKKELIQFIDDFIVENKKGNKYQVALRNLKKVILATDFSKPGGIEKITDLLVKNREKSGDKNSLNFGFDIRRSFFEKFFVSINKVNPTRSIKDKKTGEKVTVNNPAVNLRNLLFDMGFNSENFFKEYGEKAFLDSREGKTIGDKMNDGNFALTGFYVDPYMKPAEYVKKSKSGTFKHIQFNSQFHGVEPFALDGKVYVNALLPEARFITKKGKPVDVHVSAAGSMYPRVRGGFADVLERVRQHDEEMNSMSSLVHDKTGFVTVPSMISIVASNNPNYLGGVMNHIQSMGERLKGGNVGIKDLAKAYLMTISSIRAGAINAQNFENAVGEKVPELFLEEGGMIRTEGAMAYLITTDKGKRLLRNIESGKIDNADRQFIAKSMKPFGMFSEGESKYENLFGPQADKQINLNNIADFKTILKSGVKDESELFKAITKLKGVSQAKVGFVSNFIGIGTRAVMDAREIQGWLRGITFKTEDMTAKEARLAKELAKSNAKLTPLQVEIFRRIRAVGDAFGIDPMISEYIGHHMIWDAVKGQRTTHDGLYLAMSQTDAEFDKKLKEIESSKTPANLLLSKDEIKETMESRSSFIGGNANLTLAARADKAKAILLEKMGKTPSEIRMMTGWEKGKDGLWRYELSTKNAKVKFKIDSLSKIGKFYNLESVFDFPELYEAYPDLKKYKIGFSKEGSGGIGNASVSIENKKITLRISGYESMNLGETIEKQKMLDKINALNDDMKSALKYYAEKDAFQKELEKTTELFSNDFYRALEEKFPREMDKKFEDVLKENGFAEEKETFGYKYIVPSDDFMKMFFSQRDSSRNIFSELDLNSDEIKATILHEVQHIIQSKEGFAEGGNEFIAYAALTPAEITKYKQLEKNKKELLSKISSELEAGRDMTKEEENVLFGPSNYLHRKYKQIAGEVEARNVESRMNLTDEERRAKTMKSTEDEGRNKQVILINGTRVDKNAPKPTAKEIAKDLKMKKGDDFSMDGEYDVMYNGQRIAGMYFDKNSSSWYDAVYTAPTGNYAKDFYQSFLGFSKEEALEKIAEKYVEQKEEMESKSSLTDTESRRKAKDLYGYNTLMDSVVDLIEEMVGKDAEEYQILKQARQLIKASQVYKDANAVQREEMYRYVNTLTSQREKMAPSHNRLFGLIGQNLTPAARLLRARKVASYAKGKSDTKAAMNQARRDIAEALRYMHAKTGNISISQAKTIVKRFANVNLYNIESINRFIYYMDSMFADAEYNNKLNIARATRTNINELAADKNKDINLVTLAKQFSKIDPSMVEDIDEYNKIANEIKESLKGSKATGQNVNFANMVSVADASAYVNETMEKQREKLRKYLEDEVNEMLANMGVVADTAQLTYKDLQDIKASLETTDNTTKYNESIVRSLLNRMFSINASIIDGMFENGVNPITGEDVEFSEAQKALVRQFMSMDLNMLSVKLALQSVDALANFIQNGSIARMATVVMSYEGTRKAKILENQNVRSVPLRKLWNKRFGRAIAYFQKSLPSLFENMFVGEAAGAKVMKAMGITDLINKKAKSETEANNIANEYVNLFYNTKPNGENFNTEFNNVERGMGAFLLRTVIGTQSEMDEEFNRRLGLVRETIDVLRDGNEKEQKMAEVYSKVYDKLVINASPANVMNSMDVDNLAAIVYWNTVWESKFDEMSDVAESIYNRKINKEMFYTPDFYKRTSKFNNENMITVTDVNGNVESVDVSELTSADMAYLRNTGGFYKKSTGRLMNAVRPKELPRNSNNKNKVARYIDLSFDSNNANALYDALVDINTAQYIRQVETFMDTNSFDNIVRSEEDRAIVKKRISQYINNIREKNPFSSDDEVSAFLRAANGYATVSAAQALAGFTQPLKQVIPVAVNTLFNTGGRLDVSAPFDSRKLAFILNSGRGIANRGIESLAEIESLNKIIEKASESKTDVALEKIRNANKALLKIFLQKPDVYIAQMSWFSYYEQNLRQRGIAFSYNELNEEAADYAQRQVDRQQNISDHDLAGRIFNPNASGKWKDFHSFMLKVVMPFASFRINQASRLANDLRVIQKWNLSTKEDKTLAMRSLVGYAAENFVFKTISGGISYLIGMAVLNARGVDDDDEEYKAQLQKKLDFIVEYQRAGYALDILSPNPIFDGVMQSALYNMIEGIQNMSGVAEEDKFVFPDAPKMDWIKNLGQFGITVDKGMQIYELAKLASTGEFTDKYNRKRWIIKEDQDALALLVGPAILAAIGIGFTEVNSLSKAMIRDAKFESSTEEGGKYRSQVRQEKILKKTKKTTEESEKKEKLKYLNKALSLAETESERKSVFREIKLLKMNDEQKKEFEKKQKSYNRKKKEDEKRLLGQYESKEEMRRYDPSEYKKMFGKKSWYYEKYGDDNWANRKVKEIQTHEEDKRRGFTPKTRKKKTED